MYNNEATAGEVIVNIVRIEMQPRKARKQYTTTLLVSRRFLDKVLDLLHDKREY